MSKLSYKLFILSVIILLFCGNAVLSLFGWQIDYSEAPTFQKLRPEFYLLGGICISFLFHNRRKKNIRCEVVLIVLSFFLILYWLLLDQLNGFAIIPNTILIPVFISIILTFPIKGCDVTVRKLILSFFILNSLMAYYERLIGYNIIPYYSGGELDLVEQFSNVDFSGFRSTGLRNHPLSNSVLIATILPFIYLDKRLKYWQKTFLLLLGYGSFFCFNTRSSILICGAIFVFYVIYDSMLKKTNKVSNRFSGIVLVIIGIAFALCLFSQGMGDRLLERGNLQDSSVEARLMLFNLFLDTDISEFLVGMSNDSMQSLVGTVGLIHIENFWFMYLCRFGLVFFLLFIIGFCKMLHKWYNGIKIVDSLFLILPALIVASTNNSIYSGDPVIALLILCSFGFIKDTSQSPEKY